MMMSLFLGALLPTRRTAAMVATLLFVISYFGNNLAAMLDAPTAVRAASPFYYYDASETVLLHGPQTEDVLLLLGVAGMLWGLGMLCFQRRDLTVNTWPWRWPSFQQPR